MSPSVINGLEILRHDHQRIRDLFDAFEESDALPEQRQAVESLILEIRIHTRAAEEVFYPILREAAQMDPLLDAAGEELQDIAVVIEDLLTLHLKDPLFGDKLMELEEKVLSHIHQEESDLFQEAESAGLDLQELGGSLQEIRDTLQEEPSLIPRVKEPPEKRKGNSPSSAPNPA